MCIIDILVDYTACLDFITTFVASSISLIVSVIIVDESVVTAMSSIHSTSIVNEMYRRTKLPIR